MNRRVREFKVSSSSFQVRSLSFFVSFFSLFTFHFSLCSQSTISPYSRYGIGDIQSNTNAANTAMGGVSIAMQNDSITPFFINSVNPASYASIKLTAFEVGLLNNRTTFKDNTSSQTRNNTSLSYIAFGIPMNKWWGASFGLSPLSSVGYKITEQKNLDSLNTLTNIYEGSGGINKLYLGNGFKIKQFSFGVNASYLFGNITNLRKNIFSDASYVNSRINESVRLSDVYFDYGVQYSFKIDSLINKKAPKIDSLGRKLPIVKRDIDDIKFIIGLTYATQTKIDAKQSLLEETYKLYAGEVEQVRDTVQNKNGIKGSVTIPMSVGGGFAVKKGQQWLLSADYTIQDWSNFKSSFDTTGVLKNSMKFCLGGQYMPAKRNDLQNSYWKKINYRLGAKYIKTYFYLPNQQIVERSVSFGLGLPVGRIRFMQQFSVLNATMEIGERGSMDYLKENYFKLTLGLTINDRWFIKSKFD